MSNRYVRRECLCGCGRICRSADGYTRFHKPISTGPGATKQCARCGAIRLLVDFYDDKRTQDRKRSWCKPCDRTRMSTKRARLKENDPNGLKQAERRRQIQKTYSITVEEFEAIFDSQGGKCFICHRVPKAKALSVDHDHSCCGYGKSCGKCIRALLCSRCNGFLGTVRDSPAALLRAIQVLEEHPAQAAIAEYWKEQA